ncbi:MAG: hypothetical protein LQ340_007834, partial [Diploschistes diacapsis]
MAPRQRLSKYRPTPGRRRRDIPLANPPKGWQEWDDPLPIEDAGVHFRMAAIHNPWFRLFYLASELLLFSANTDLLRRDGRYYFVLVNEMMDMTIACIEKPRTLASIIEAFGKEDWGTYDTHCRIIDLDKIINLEFSYRMAYECRESREQLEDSDDEIENEQVEGKQKEEERLEEQQIEEEQAEEPQIRTEQVDRQQYG